MQAVKRLLAGTAAAVAVLSGAAGAGAAVFFNQSPTAPDGSISWSFGNDGGIAAGDFDETFTFLIPTAGVWSGNLTSSFTSAANNLIFDEVATINGAPYTTFTPHFESFEMLPATAGGATILVHGLSPGPAGSYVGSLTFSPVGLVPEPAAWALLIMGFGGAGAMLRQRRRLAVA